MTNTVKKANSASAVVRIPARLDARLSALSERTGRPKAYYARKALERYLDDTEDYLLAVSALEEPGRNLSLEEVVRDLGLEDRVPAEREPGHEEAAAGRPGADPRIPAGEAAARPAPHRRRAAG